MRCIIIEDQPPAQRILKKYIEDHGSLEVVGVFGDALQGLEFLKTNKVDLIFLDIHLPKLSGIDFLKTLTNPPPVILTTAFPDFALEGFDLNVVDYLLKPFSFPRFIQAIGKVPQKVENQENIVGTESIFIKTGYDYVKIDFIDILFIKSDKDYTEIMTRDRMYLSSEPLKHWLEYFGENKIIQVHKSYIVNVKNILKVTTMGIDVGHKNLIPIGRFYKEPLITMIQKEV